MISTNQNRIVRSATIDDGTTCGKKVYYDIYGKAWVPTTKTRQPAGTADNIQHIDSRGNFVYRTD